MTTNKGRGLLNTAKRIPGNFQPSQAYNEKENSTKEKEISDKKAEAEKIKNQKFKNQEGTIKTSIQTKEELQALKNITKTKFDYEIIDLLIDTYVNNELTPEQRRKFKAMT
ncbi:hypothetical protein D4900_15935, partial [Listeria monocytogenes]|nr:hypothetical protein [Listeria monocytogenes]EAH2231082.1 hypothetical protein [Listeria monocytogenes]ECR2378448.1 hypothetical protein [Listeria monocytogenes]EGP9670632.1 hypothetical protein [Listeria monocytogenes]EGT1718677.1 hypothetical protein [Listeria monocytogenes]